MTRTTPPRPVDIAAVFPELAPLARSAVRLHPRLGQPSVHESSIGGPLLWPAGEHWPTCTAEHELYDKPVSVDDVRRRRDLLDAAWLRPRAPEEDLLTPEQRSYLLELEEGHPAHSEPNPLLPVAQLYLHDVPGLTGPDGADVLQVLWCPLDHDDYAPAVRLVWRNSSEVGSVLAEPPVPLDVQDGYVPEPCVVHPEVVTEYPAPLELPEELADRLDAWSHGSSDYFTAHSIAPGWKVGGWGPWNINDPRPMNCVVCGAGYRPFLTIASGEWYGSHRSWIPIEDRDQPGPVGLRDSANPPMVEIGSDDNLQVYSCPTSFDHPHFTYTQ
ncbi:hypothetical protein ACFTSF_23285 [Kribbella sp. NPDC056951]|uniref:hypothetical protein n=1 Tax=Kribbella sp. NPDC056951 TaxID=3345978 RepID=UPI00363EDBF3